MLVAVLARWRLAKPPRAFLLQLEVTLADARSKDAAGASPRGGALALNSLADSERAQLGQLLNDLADEAERRRNPFVEDLDGKDRHRELYTRLRAWGPSFSAAAALATGAWASEDDQITVRATDTCVQRPPSTVCLPLVRAPGEVDSTERRARLFAWPIARALVLRVLDPGQARALATSLRTNLDREHTSIALALESTELHGLRLSPELVAVARATDRLEELLADAGPLSAEESELLTRLAGSTTVSDALPWLQLPEGEVLVAPRLGALATRELFVDEVTQRASESRVGFEWVYRGE